MSLYFLWIVSYSFITALAAICYNTIQHSMNLHGYTHLSTYLRMALTAHLILMSHLWFMPSAPSFHLSQVSVSTWDYLDSSIHCITLRTTSCTSKGYAQHLDKQSSSLISWCIQPYCIVNIGKSPCSKMSWFPFYLFIRSWHLVSHSST